MANWFVSVGDREQGPFVDAQIRELARNGKLTPKMKVRREGSDRFVEAGSIRGLFTTVSTPTPVASSPPAPAAPSTLKQLQTIDLPAAERAIGLKAHRLAVVASMAGKRYAKLASIDDKIAKGEAELAAAKNKFETFAVTATLKALRKTQAQLQEEVGRIIRLHPSDDAIRRLGTELSVAQAIADRLVKMGGKPKYHPGPVAIVFTGLVVVGFAALMVAISPPISKGEGDAGQAIVASQEFVRNSLQHPGAAEFPWFGAMAEPLKDNPRVWRAIGEVEASNAFGMRSTIKWSTLVYLKDADTGGIGDWECCYLSLDGKMMHVQPIPKYPP
ncbi:DUF4339 domain-containing protein [Lacipirellula parvula]|uniref:GYF domain-containing protein n=1 Tax=Lacipirellula parvula TaxID=2650471 RepID=A0A5K7XEE7_9BACT|nr:DUF4339 domain-containing protein [Lacipirellula parvula]BBO34437.1 hypothetical protein PLANPX_4049 [Lacipirellula parvula]